MDPRHIFIQADHVFETYALALEPDHWDMPVPSAPDWTVRDLLVHVLSDDDWVPDLLSGHKPDEVGDRHADDPLEGDARTAIMALAEGAQAAARAVEELDQTVHLSYGDEPAYEYLLQMAGDRLVHAWDLAVATGQVTALPADLVEAVLEYMAPNIDDWRASGLFAPAVPVANDAPLQDRLVALTGRDPRLGAGTETYEPEFHNGEPAA